MGGKKAYIRGTVYTTTQGAETLAPVFAGAGVSGYSVEDAADLAYVRGDFLEVPDIGRQDARTDGFRPGLQSAKTLSETAGCSPMPAPYVFYSQS